MIRTLLFALALSTVVTPAWASTRAGPPESGVETCAPIPSTLTPAWAEGTWDVKQGDKNWFTLHISSAPLGVKIDLLRLSDTSWHPLKVPSLCSGPLQTMVLFANDTETAEHLRITLGAAPGDRLTGTVAGTSAGQLVGVTATRHDLGV